MYDLLSRIPANERIADLRLMTDASDVALAILASASEPTYFAPVIDPHPEKVLIGDHHNVLESVRHRIYNGCYIISMPAQDVRRMLPGIHVVGSGWKHNPLLARTLLKNTRLADCEEIAFLREWWADLEVNPDAEFESHIEVRDLSGEEEFQFGVRRAKELFDSDSGLPAFAKPPHFRTPAAAAIDPLKPQANMFIDSDHNAPRTLKTMLRIAPISLRSSGPR